MSMYIYANLPGSYGSFNKIREDNYPFNRLFPKYLSTLVKLGNREGLDIFSLLGHIENELFDGNRLPDMPTSGETVSFRFSVDDEDIESYYRDQDLTNKMITQMIIRTTIRLTAVYGTSLSRLCAIIDSIDDEIREREIDEETKETKEIEDLKEKLRIKRKQSERVKPVRARVEEPAAGDIKDDLLRKINEISKKAPIIDDNPASEGTADNADVAKDKTSDTEKVVETNPYLKDFF